MKIINDGVYSLFNNRQMKGYSSARLNLERPGLESSVQYRLSTCGYAMCIG